MTIGWIVGCAIFFAACGSTHNSLEPEQVVFRAFQEWAGRDNIGYDNVAIVTLDEEDGTAIVQITAAFQYDPAVPWLEEQATVRLSRVDGEWTTLDFFPFAPTDHALERIRESQRGATPVPSEEPSSSP